MTQPNTLGDNLISINQHPPGLHSYKKRGVESLAYYEKNAYPYFGFQNWRTESLGNFPLCLPISQMIINKSARWLFGKPIDLTFTGPSNVGTEIDKIIKANHLNTRLVAAAQKGGIEGGIFIKFSLDLTKEVPVRFQFLSTVNQVECFYNPHDIEELLMVRIQYPYKNLFDGKFYWYREEWTSTTEVHYFPIEINNFGLSRENPYEFVGIPIFPKIDTDQNWVISSTEPNRFGIIPGILVKNAENGTEFGSPDLEGLFRTIDRICLSYHLMNRSNQFDIDPVTLFIDLEPKDSDSLTRPMQPGGFMDLKTIDGDPELGETKSQGRAQILENQGKMREHLRNYANDMMQLLFDCTGAVFPRQEHVTNKGSLTQSVLIQMYEPLLEVTNEKRKSYGDNGLCRLVSTLALGLKNFGMKPFGTIKSVTSIYDEKIAANINWFSQFELTEDEKFAEFDRLDRAAKGGYLAVSDVVQRINQLEELPLTNQKQKELEGKVNESIEFEKKSKTGFGNESDRRRGNDPGGNEDGQKSRQQQGGNRVKDAE